MSMTLISTITVGAGGAASIEFSSIPQTGQDLYIIGSLRDNGAAVIGNININLNNNAATIYSAKRLYGTGSGVGTDAFSSLNSMPGTWINSATSTALTFNNFSWLIPNFAGSINKSVSMDSVTENNATAANAGISAGLFASTAAISAVAITAGGNTFSQYSTVSLYTISTTGASGASVA